MKILVQSIHFDADTKLIDFVNEKANKLQHFYEHLVSIEVYLKLDKSTEHANKVVEIKVHIPGKVLFSKEQSSTFEVATDEAIEAISKQVKKEKEKSRGL